MIRWFFLLFIAILVFAVNAATIDSNAGIIRKFIVLIVGNVFLFSLFGIWLISYYEKYSKKGIFSYSPALLILSMSIGLLCIEYDALFSGICTSSRFESFYDVVSYMSLPVSNSTSCRIYSFVMIILCIQIALLGLKTIRNKNI